jgi:hypothetical protein
MLNPEQLQALKDLIRGMEPVGEDEIEEAMENASDGGNFNDTWDNGYDMGCRAMADDIRSILGLD